MLKNCEQITSELLAYIDDMLPEDEAKKIAEHLATCEHCQAEYEFLKGIQSTAKNMPELSVSQRLHANILESLDAQLQNPQKTKFNIWKIASKVTVAAAVVAISVISLNNLPTQPEPAPIEITQDVTQTAQPGIDLTNQEKGRMMPQPTTKPDFSYQTEENMPENNNDVAVVSLDFDKQEKRHIAINDSVVYVLNAEGAQKAKQLLTPYEKDGIYLVPRGEFDALHNQIINGSDYISHELFETEPPAENLEIIIKIQ